MGGVPYYGATWYPLLLLVQSLAFPHWTATFPGHTIIWRVPSISSTLGTVIGTQSGLNFKNKKQRLWNGLMKVDQGRTLREQGTRMTTHEGEGPPPRWPDPRACARASSKIGNPKHA